MDVSEYKEFKLLSRLDTPQKIQKFLDRLPMNHEENGETCMSPLRVLRERKAHCIEAGFLAGLCLRMQGQKPLIVNLKVETIDVDHVVALFKQNGYYGAISKTNHVGLRYRDPIYRSVRELVMTYFHEYNLTKNGRKTLLGYSNPINLNRFGTKWITAHEDLWDIAEKIYDAPYISVVPKENRKYLYAAQPFERRVSSIPEWKA
jgi:hypothetical protein